MLRVKPSVIVLALLFVLTAFMLARLWELHFSRSDIFPAYSSMRADPLGARGFYDLVTELDGYAVSRNFKPLQRLDEMKDTTVFFLAVGVGERDANHPFAEGNLERLLEIPVAGNRLILAFEPLELKEYLDHEMGGLYISGPGGATPPGAGSDSAPAGAGGGRASTDTTAVGLAPPVASGPRGFPVIEEPQVWEVAGEDIRFRWNANVGSERLGWSTTQLGPGAPPEMKRLRWHSPLFFRDLDANWRVVQTFDGKPVMVERAYGKGTIIMLADSFPLSNEALQAYSVAATRRSENPGIDPSDQLSLGTRDLLVYVLGPNRDVVFNEAHLGVVSQGGVASLGRSLRLHGLIGGLLLLVLLFIWKNSSSLVPARSPFDEQGLLLKSDQDVDSGFVNLMHRHIPRQQLVQLCFEEWRRSQPASTPKRERQIREAADIFETESGVAPTDRRPLQTYKALCRILAERKARK